MTWPIRHIPPPLWGPDEPCKCGDPACKSVNRARVRADGTRPQIGDAWYEPETLDGELSPYSYHLSCQYEERYQGKRSPIVVVLPGVGHERVHWFCVDSHYWRKGVADPGRNGWTVTGRLEDRSLTLAPSINVGGIYHGFIRNGVITDDVEGRKYDTP